MDAAHIAFMQRALKLATQAKGRTSPNPLVGAVIVKDGKVIGEGYHQKAGTPHAEVHALNAAGENAKGATLYTTLEPCCHWGRTPPCTEALIRAGIAQVYIAGVDPNPSVAGKGIRQLKRAGIDVYVDVCKHEAEKLNEVHTKYIQTGLPFVILKFAMSLDGKIATATGESRWITSEASRQRGHEIRDEVDAILVGRGTVERDNPALTTRLQGRHGQDAIRIVMDSHARTPTDARIFNVKSSAGVIVAVTPEAASENVEALEKSGAEVITVPEAHGNQVCFKGLMEILGKREITSVLIEGGGEINASAIAAGIVDKVMCFVAPIIIGGRNAPGPVGGEGFPNLTDVPHFRGIHITQIPDSDFLIEGYL
ncbi:bifunctional diaminohydroxyphosphoribosylaminopyrimidine deaminase/5-amino-6-(5-phosphoribosylamino)uracil reductase RibD [Candidatus Poribacteria bacterium]|nr:bifunctional diaminohydroxyphosphoribosylaminopyrimidine deaminase/5-amino-6-(5-phosphoribosylamino)uracil reductase RibD [Candidatus Poribacteria bacterium]MYB01164.1 bifunctional diaminohydroxyphosphoribosylaminopyrimidine deaminase/5-amino-6-(5-phosphoribosylamino)uracil reductase RibD [Candidatus Poribacteria bacterium]